MLIVVKMKNIGNFKNYVKLNIEIALVVPYIVKIKTKWDLKQI